jgi:hypothetical protein
VRHRQLLAHGINPFSSRKLNHAIKPNHITNANTKIAAIQDENSHIRYSITPNHTIATNSTGNQNQRRRFTHANKAASRIIAHTL